MKQNVKYYIESNELTYLVNVIYLLPSSQCRFCKLFPPQRISKSKFGRRTTPQDFPCFGGWFITKSSFCYLFQMSTMNEIYFYLKNVLFASILDLS